ncbi:ABC transporter permease subunit [Phaeobacter sp. J2-8]|uniref:ABC transporter permease subunit n=1 Tax=Phaeobacter sp. J2-8 TaxID=2931394 RepID=UPI001FD54C0F|nr:ABC transporter permease subunit [Phaeobacter sp. J2-8]MCJ7873352.1 ABC transporter permease subunit [Phaeobacter sp. J2-8]
MSLTSTDLGLLIQGLGLTAWMTLWGTLLALALAVPLALCLRSNRFWISAPARVYVEVMRGAPLVLLLFLLYYGGPQIGLRLSAPVAGIVGLGFFGAGAFAEILRAGLNAVPTGDVEAASMLGINRFKCIVHIEIPQAVRTVIPPIFGQTIILVKEFCRLIRHNHRRTHQSGQRIGDPHLFCATVYRRGASVLGARRSNCTGWTCR